MREVNFFKKLLLMIFHPLDCFVMIKRERAKFRLLPIALLYISAIFVNYIYIFIVHFPLSEKQSVDANFGLEIAMVAIPLFTWTVASYAITAIINGESHFTELLTANAYSLIPYIILTPVLGAVSNVLSYEQSGIYFFFKTLSLLWVLLLLFLALKYLNDYTLWETVGVAVLSIIAMVVVWAVVLLVASLTLQLFTFFADIYNEISYKF